MVSLQQERLVGDLSLHDISTPMWSDQKVQQVTAGERSPGDSGITVWNTRNQPLTCLFCSVRRLWSVSGAAQLVMWQHSLRASSVTGTQTHTHTQKAVQFTQCSPLLFITYHMVLCRHHVTAGIMNTHTHTENGQEVMWHHHNMFLFYFLFRLSSHTTSGPNIEKKRLCEQRFDSFTNLQFRDQIKFCWG